MKNSGIKNLIHLIEELRNKDNYVESCIIKTQLEGFTVIETENIDESVCFIKNIDTKIRKYKKFSSFDFDFPRVLNIKFHDFNNQNLKTRNFKEENLLYLSFLSIKGVTYQKTKFLGTYFGTFRKIFEIINDIDNFRKLLNKIKIDGNMIGENVVENIINLFT